MSPLERFLLASIMFLVIVRVFILPDERERTAVESQLPGPPDAAVEAADAGAPYDWNPDQFTRRGIPAKLTLTPDGRVPDTMRLTDTQKAFVYAAMLNAHDSLLTRAHEDCPLDLRRDIVRWQARNARTIADAEEILNRLTPDRDIAGKPHDALSRDVFAVRVCPTIEHYLRTGAYNPHPEVVARLAHAARGALPQRSDAANRPAPTGISASIASRAPGRSGGGPCGTGSPRARSAHKHKILCDILVNRPIYTLDAGHTYLSPIEYGAPQA